MEEKFSLGSEDREKLLLSRRERLVRDARKKYLEKLATSKETDRLDSTQIKVDATEASQ